jgi:alkylation response protein AidB-like acyl-CoA dehydrogenase
MIVPAGIATRNDPPVLHAAVELVDMIETMSAEQELGRRLPPAVAAAMKDAGIFGMAMPRDWGGPELDPLIQWRVIETLAMANGSAGWCAVINCDSGYASAFLDQEVARGMYPDINVATGGSVAPLGVATRVDGGYRVTGRFPFCSGVHHCEWMFLGCTVFEDGSPRRDANGVPETLQCFLRQSEFEILDTWDTTGLRGTGSNHVSVDNVFVPANRTFSFQDPFLVKREGLLYAFPLMFLAKGTAPALGIARRAIDFLTAEAVRKPARQFRLDDRMETPRRLSENVYVQDAVARADAMVAAARSHVFQVIGELWETLIEGRRPTPLLEARFGTLYPHAAGACLEAVQLVYKAAGGAAVYRGVLDRCMRDMLAINQHTLGSLRHYEMAGRLLLGLTPLSPLL